MYFYFMMYRNPTSYISQNSPLLLPTLLPEQTRESLNSSYLGDKKKMQKDFKVLKFKILCLTSPGQYIEVRELFIKMICICT